MRARVLLPLLCAAFVGERYLLSLAASASWRTPLPTDRILPWIGAMIESLRAGFAMCMFFLWARIGPWRWIPDPFPGGRPSPGARRFACLAHRSSWLPLWGIFLSPQATVPWWCRRQLWCWRQPGFEEETLLQADASSGRSLRLWLSARSKNSRRRTTKTKNSFFSQFDLNVGFCEVHIEISSPWRHFQRLHSPQ